MSLAIAGGISAAHAQVPRIELPGSVQPGRDQPLPLPIAPESDFDFTIQAPKRAPVPRAADELTFTLRDIVVTGATIYPPTRCGRSTNRSSGTRSSSPTSLRWRRRSRPNIARPDIC
jgi:hypothetical protein